MRILLLIIALCFMGCQQFQNTVGCYSETEFGIGYDHRFGDSSIDGRYVGGDASGHNHGNPKNHSPASAGSGWFSGDSFSEDRIATEVRVHFKPGACD